MAIAPGVLCPNSPGIGMAFKLSDGDPAGRARPVVVMALLEKLGLIDAAAVQKLAQFDRRKLYNFRKIEIGEIRACF